jgi:hypothetical protein
MTNTKILAIAASMAALIACAPAQAQHRGHFHGPRVTFGIGLGFGAPYYPYYRPYYYAPYPYYYPPVVIRPLPPPVYIERPDTIDERMQPQAQYQAPAPAQPRASVTQNDWWFYCPDSQAYYPYVQQCSVEWQRVTPRPPAP